MKLRQLLYLIESGGLYKIGVSQDVNKRIRNLQTGSAHTVICVAYYQTDKPAREVESALHKLFAKYRLRGEWFDFEDRFTQEAFDTLCSRYGMTKLEFNENGTCKTVEETPKIKPQHKFGDIPNSSTIRTDQQNVEYWRKRYGIGKYKR